MRPLIVVLSLALLAACGPSYRDTSAPIAAQADLDAERYLGLWYEIARFPVPFQKGCTATTAEYGRIDADTIGVLNTCREGSPDGPTKQIAGSADIVGPGKLKVKFDSVPLIRGDYWVLYIDEDYSLAVVGAPRGTTGWILARTPSISAEERSKAEEVLRRNGYDTSRLREVLH